jgi:hypothetical protein
MQVLIGALGLLVVCLIFLLMSDVKEGYEDAMDDADYTQKYTKQMEDYLKIEEVIKESITMFSKPQFTTWNTKVDKSSLQKRIEALPNPLAYIKALKENSEFIDRELIENDVDESAIRKINAATSFLDLGLKEGEREMKDIANIKEDLKKALDNMTLSSLSKFKKRGLELLKNVDEIFLLLFKTFMKIFMRPKEPVTAKEYMKYEIKNFTIPLWKPLQFVLGRLSKLMSIGPDGKKKYSDNEAMGIAIKDLSEKSKVSDIDKFYTLMSKTKGSPPVETESLDKLFSDPMAYLNLITYLNGKMNESTSAAKSEGFFGGLMVEGWEDEKKSKCVPCKIEPEVEDTEGLKKRYTILKNSRNQYKGEISNFDDRKKKIEEIEKKAMSGELMNEMIANRKIE